MNVFLRTCPFCGSVPMVMHLARDMPPMVAIQCVRAEADDPCPVGPSLAGESVEAVSARWNTRIGAAA